jgi:feruloyl esterase
MGKFQIGLISTVLVLIPAISPSLAAAGTSCDKLASVALPNAKIDSAQSVPAGDFTLPGVRGGQSRTFKGLPAFCRVAMTLKPSSDSDIKVELWLPANWNGKLLAIGNGGWAGTIGYGGMATALKDGFAVTSTDTGHSTPGGSFALGHPEKLIDFGWRSEHEMTVKAKAVVAAFYGRAPKYAYWSGCSTGGRQGLMEATRFPNDFDGIVAGDPSNPRATRNAWQVSMTIASHKPPAGVLPDAKLKVIHEAVLAACDQLDGVKDGILENPKACRFDPASLLCKGEDAPACLTAPQVASAKLMISPGRFSNGQEYHPGLELGSETGYYPGRGPGWSEWAGDHADPTEKENYKYVVYKDPNWDWHTFNADTGVRLAQKMDEGTVDVTKTDFSAFKGKLIMFHGWGDPSVAPQGTINYYNAVLKTTPKAADSIRLFMVPGMGHCGGGDGATDHFDMIAALDRWVDKGQAPTEILATHVDNGIVTRSRPLCPYPQTAAYKGAGSTDDAANFVCKAP